jgi:hypothetical protein
MSEWQGEFLSYQDNHSLKKRGRDEYGVGRGRRNSRAGGFCMQRRTWTGMVKRGSRKTRKQAIERKKIRKFVRGVGSVKSAPGKRRVCK